MNRKLTVLLISCLCLLAACASLDRSLAAEDAPPVRTGPAPDYQFDLAYLADRHFSTGENGETELAYYRYQLHALSVPNLEDLSAEDAEAAERNMEAFNAKMSGLLAELVSHGQEMGSDATSLQLQEGYTFPGGGFYDETSSRCELVGEVVSVRLDSASYTGGAHPNAYTSSYLFDLRTGQFIDATQLAEDPEAFRTGAAALLKKKADAIQENRGNYWPDYEEILSRWNEAAVLFDEEGLLELVSAYDLGPYAMGPVELRLDCDELADLIGPGGMERLGAAEGS